MRNIYVNLDGLKRNGDMSLKDDRLREWIESTVDDVYCRYVKVGLWSPKYVVGIYLTSEEATAFKLMFEYGF